MKTVLRFHAAWCGPCKELSRTIDAMKENGTFPDNIKLVEVDVDTEPDLCATYSIRSVPTLVMLNEKGVVAKRLTGASNPARLLEWFTN